MEESPFLLETDDPDVQNLIQDYEPLGAPPSPTSAVEMTTDAQSSQWKSMELIDDDWLDLLTSPAVVKPERSASCPPDQETYLTTVFASDGTLNVVSALGAIPESFGENPEEFASTSGSASGSGSARQSAKFHHSKRHATSPRNSPTWIELITKAIQASDKKMLTVHQVYEWMIENVDVCREKPNIKSTEGWKNCIRHTLSLHKQFIKIATTGMSSFWAVDEKVLEEKAAHSLRARAKTFHPGDKTVGTVRQRLQKRVVAPASGVSQDLIELPKSSTSADPQQQEFFDSQQQEYPDSQQQEFSDVQQQEYPDSQQQEFSDSQQQEYPDSQQQEYRDSQQQEYPDSQQQEYSTAKRHEYSTAQQQEFSDVQQQEYPIVFTRDGPPQQTIASDSVKIIIVPVSVAEELANAQNVICLPGPSNYYTQPDSSGMNVEFPNSQKSNPQTDFIFRPLGEEGLDEENKSLCTGFGNDFSGIGVGPNEFRRIEQNAFDDINVGPSGLSKMGSNESSGIGSNALSGTGSSESSGVNVSSSESSGIGSSALSRIGTSESSRIASNAFDDMNIGSIESSGMNIGPSESSGMNVGSIESSGMNVGPSESSGVGSSESSKFPSSSTMADVENPHRVINSMGGMMPERQANQLTEMLENAVEKNPDLENFLEQLERDNF